MKLLSGTANQNLSNKIAKTLKLKLVNSNIRRFNSSWQRNSFILFKGIINNRKKIQRLSCKRCENIIITKITWWSRNILKKTKKLEVINK